MTFAIAESILLAVIAVGYFAIGKGPSTSLPKQRDRPPRKRFRERLRLGAGPRLDKKNPTE